MKHIIVANRLPVTLRNIKGQYRSEVSVGGLTSGMTAYLHNHKLDYVWIGWPGEAIDEKDKETATAYLRKNIKAFPVYLTKEEARDYYQGFCNRVIWPLFHYFLSLCEFREKYWQAYVAINKRFAEEVIGFYEPGDSIFVQDYHLMLLPALLREKLPQAQIGFFLHIPFPTYEVFRVLPTEWKTSLLNGLLGADLLGFHTEEYTQYFLHTVLRILGFEHKSGTIIVGDRSLYVGTFPLGIDTDEFAAKQTQKAVLKEKKRLENVLGNKLIIISIDRLDYSKGILNRLEGFQDFLDKHPEYHGKVTMVMVAVPSRTGITEYRDMKRRIDETVGTINGKYGSIEWTPIIYQYRAFTDRKLHALYGIGDIALVTPLRDGMNLIAKEYIASRVNGNGVLILSELAGAAKELPEALLINPNSRKEIAEAISKALAMPVNEQKRRNLIMQERLKKFDVNWWFGTVFETLRNLTGNQYEKKNLLIEQSTILNDYHKAQKRLILLDYDGTLVPFAPTPVQAKPSEEVLALLTKLTFDPKNSVYLISGRDRKTMDDWFGQLNISFGAEHGAFNKRQKEDWQPVITLNSTWKPEIRPVLERYVERLPKSLIEEKEYGLAWHYRLADETLGEEMARQLRTELMQWVANRDLQVTQGSKVVEVRNAGVNKGSSVLLAVAENHFDFVLAIGDDTTDEDMFAVLPEPAYTVKVGSAPTKARFRLKSPEEVNRLLEILVGNNVEKGKGAPREKVQEIKV